MAFPSRSGVELKKEIVTHSSILAWKIPRIEEPGRLQSIEWQTDILGMLTYTDTHTEILEQCIFSIKKLMTKKANDIMMLAH